MANPAPQATHATHATHAAHAAHAESPNDETRQLVVNARAGRREAFEALFRRHRAELELHVQRRFKFGRAVLDRSDLVQESLLDAVRAFGAFEPQGRGSFRAWLARIAENRFKRMNRDRRALKRDAACELAAPSAAAERATSETSPSHGAARAETSWRLRRALARLPEDHERAIRFVKLEELPLATVAQRLGRSENAVKKLLARALLALRDELAREEGA